jgi:response regulator RpfG family c-di-GMP phosphodiesterase
LGAGILAQLEYLLFEYQYKKIATNVKFYVFNERISRRIVETFFILSIAPAATLLLILSRYKYEGIISSHVIYEMAYVVTLFIVFAAISAVAFGRMLKIDTQKILENIGIIKNGSYDISIDVNRADELGEISTAIENMAKHIQDGINEIESLNEEIVSTQREVVYTMGEIAESRSKETGNHVKRVATYSGILALRYGLSAQEAKLLKLASPMHDIGKVAILDNILNKPGKHTPEEFEIMKTHAILGYGMLKHSERTILKAASIVAYEHHEKWDGSGYPRGLSGENIHIYGRITAVADVFDALGSDRCYKKAWEDERIFELLRDQSGKHFDPELVELFFASFDEIDIVRQKYRDL